MLKKTDKKHYTPYLILETKKRGLDYTYCNNLLIDVFSVALTVYDIIIDSRPDILEAYEEPNILLASIFRRLFYSKCDSLTVESLASKYIEDYDERLSLEMFMYP